MGSSLTINGSIRQAPKLQQSRIWLGTPVHGREPTVRYEHYIRPPNLVWRLRYDLGVAAVSIRSIGSPPCFHTRFQLVHHRRASSLFSSVPNNQTTFLTVCLFSVPGWTFFLRQFLIIESKASLCWRSLITNLSNLFHTEPTNFNSSLCRA